MRYRVQRHLLVPGFAVCVVALAAAASMMIAGDSDDANIFYDLYRWHDVSAAALYLALFAAAGLFARRLAAAPVEKAVRWLGHRAIAVAATAAVFLAAGTVIVYHNHPLSMDEYTPIFQARLFSTGQLWAEYPPDLVDWLIPDKFVKLFFSSSQVTGLVISSYWPGFALLLAPFVLLGAPWLLNPLLGAGSLLLLVHIARRLLPGDEAAGWVLLLTLASPQFTINALSYYSMPAHLFMNLLFMALLLRPTAWRAFAAGWVGAFALVLHQPLPHLLFALPWIAWLAARRERHRPLAMLLLGYLPLCLVLGVGWMALRSYILAMDPNALAAAQDAATEAATTTFMDRFRGALRIFALPSLEVLHFRLIGGLKLFLWAVPALPILALIGGWETRRVTALRLLSASAILSFVGFLFVPFSQGHGWGFRYFHQAWGALPLLGAALLVKMKGPDAAWKSVVGALAAASLVLGTGLRCAQVYGFVDRHLDQLPPLGGDQPRICFLDTSQGYYIEDLVQNDPLLADPVLIMSSHGKRRDEALIRSRFPRSKRVFDGHHTVWLVE